MSTKSYSYRTTLEGSGRYSFGTEQTPSRNHGSAWTKFTRFTTPHVRSPRKRRASCTSCHWRDCRKCRYFLLQRCRFLRYTCQKKGQATPLNLNDSNRAFHTGPYTVYFIARICVPNKHTNRFQTKTRYHHCKTCCSISDSSKQWIPSCSLHPNP